MRQKVDCLDSVRTNCQDKTVFPVAKIVPNYVLNNKNTKTTFFLEDYILQTIFNLKNAKFNNKWKERKGNYWLI